MPAAGFTKLTEEEIKLAWRWYEEDQETLAEIASRLGRDKSTLTRREHAGRPQSTSSSQSDTSRLPVVYQSFTQSFTSRYQ